MIHCMIDLETLGVSHDAVILSIGATKFDPDLPSPIVDQFYVAVDPSSGQNAGQKIQASTVMWWLDEYRGEARKRLLAEDKLPLVDAMDGFAAWYGTTKMPTWGNGAAFDLPIIEHAFRVTGVDCPWTFRQQRCYRTVRNIMPWLAVDAALERPAGTAHHALSDAIYQTHGLCRILNALGKATADA